MSERELALRAALNVLRDSIESRRMPSGELLTADAGALHERAIETPEALLHDEQAEPMGSGGTGYE